MDWRGECFLMAGVFGFALVCLLGISSLPSVTATLSWKEFAFVQSGLGWTAMLFLCAHDMFYGWPYINSPSCHWSFPRFRHIWTGFGLDMYADHLPPPLTVQLCENKQTNKQRGTFPLFFDQKTPYCCSHI